MKKILNIVKFIFSHPLAKKHKIKALYKFLNWQTSQLFPHFVAHTFVGNTKLIVKKGMTGATGNIYTGLHDFYEMGFLLHFLRPGDTFADIGANIGSYTMLASGVIGAKSICIEPVPGTFSYLLKNIRENNLQQKVTALNIAAGSENGKLMVTKELDVVNHVIVGGSVEDKTLIEVPVMRLDDVAVEDCPALIKIDVEGFEQEVLNGSSRILNDQKLKAIIIELNGSGANYGFNEGSIHQQLFDIGFIPYQYFPFERKFMEMPGYGTTNTIYLRDFEFISSRIKTAPPVSVFSEHF